MPPTRRSPRPAKRTEVAGTTYRSNFEAGVAGALHAAGVNFEYEGETFYYERPCSYTADFSWVKQDGSKIIIEAKGYFDAADRRKLLEVKRSHPQLDLRIVFQRARTKLTKAARSRTYGQWATQHGFTWAEGGIPAAWMEE